MGLGNRFPLVAAYRLLLGLAEVEKYLRCCEVASRTIESFWRVDKVSAVMVGYVLQYAVFAAPPRSTHA